MHRRLKRVVGCEAIQRQKGIHVLSRDSTLMFLRMREKQTANLGYIGAGALRARHALHDILPSLPFTCNSRLVSKKNHTCTGSSTTMHTL